MELLNTFINIIAPIFILLAIGAWLHKVFTLDLYTLAKLNIYYVVPGFIFIKLYQTSFSINLFFNTILFFTLYMVLLYMVSKVISKLGNHSQGLEVAFTNSILFFNAGNYGIPVNDLVFKHDPIALSIQVIIVTCQNIFAYSFGVFTLKSMGEGRRKALTGFFKMPILYAMIGGITLNVLNISLPNFITTSANYVANAIVAIALLTLGAQVAQLKLAKDLSSVYLSLITRLIIGPIIAYFIIITMGLDGILAKALFIASSMPTAVNSALLAQEYNNEPDYAAQVVLASTVFSMITVTIVISLSHVIF